MTPFTREAEQLRADTYIGVPRHVVEARMRRGDLEKRTVRAARIQAEDFFAYQVAARWVVAEVA